jgi:NAD-dependent DNA ligase
MKAVRELLEKAKVEYHKGTPIMSDDVYDRLEDTLVADTTVGTTVTGVRYPHAFPMYSL